MFFSSGVRPRAAIISAPPVGPHDGLTLEVIRHALQSRPRAAARGSGSSREAELLAELAHSHASAFTAQESRLHGLTLMQLTLVKQLLKREGGSDSDKPTKGPEKPVYVGAKVGTRKSKAAAAALGAAPVVIERRTKRAMNHEALVDGCEADAVQRHFCYVLHRPGTAGGATARSGGSRCSGRTTYVGYTIDPARRLRQHNGLISGGAAGTRGGRGSWGFLFVVAVGPPPSLSDAVALSAGADSGCLMPFRMHEGLSLEWHLKRRGRHGRKKVPGTRGKGDGGRNASALPDAPSPLLSPLPDPVARRIERLKDALQHRKFAPFSSRFIVYAAQDHIDVVRAVLSGLPCRVQPLTDLLRPD